MEFKDMPIEAQLADGINRPRTARVKSLQNSQTCAYRMLAFTYNGVPVSHRSLTGPALRR